MSEKKVFTVYTEKKSGFDIEAAKLLSELKSSLSLDAVTGLRIINRYDVANIAEAGLAFLGDNIFGEPAVDIIRYDLPEGAQNPASAFAVSYLPGQYDQRADSCEQCIQMITGGEKPRVKSSKIYIINGKVSASELEKIKNYIINPVESCEISPFPPQTLDEEYDLPELPAAIEGFSSMDASRLAQLRRDLGLAMDLDDLAFCQSYFSDRDPILTEIKILDTYWSDHCRHTTFLTHLENIEIEDEKIEKSFARYLEARKTVYGERAATRPVTLMDIATIGAKYLKKTGKLNLLDESEEINACSVNITPKINGRRENWLLMFKNETHNHPTEIEPFGGAATCIGGAIRDPLSGRSYVYQAMRVTGAADPNQPYAETMKNKLPQRKICLDAAAGYSSYGNQIGLATGIVSEVYHPGYAAKRLETGAVIAAAPKENVRRETPSPGDVVILIGGRTGRDGCGGATGSSKAHNKESLSSCGAEVQKGNAPEERKIQRLFRNPEVTRLIIRCNDFGAGGVSVAVGELAEGLDIYLDRVPKKYNGLNATELAISESQERMAVVIPAKDAEKFIKLAGDENLEATVVAEVTDKKRMTMYLSGKIVADLSRDFLDSNGASKTAAVRVKRTAPPAENETHLPVKERFISAVSELNEANQKGLADRFDSTVGANTVFMPYGGSSRMTPAQSMTALLPVEKSETDFCSVMSYGFTPTLNNNSAYDMAVTSVVSSVAKLTAAGCSLKNGDNENCWLSLQEFFPSPKDSPERWSLPFCALLGALDAQLELGLAAIGGKDSMSGSYENLDVPPTLLSFAVSTQTAGNVISPEFKTPGNSVYLIAPAANSGFSGIRETLACLESGIAGGDIVSAYSLSECPAASAAAKMAFGNKLGIKFSVLPSKQLFWKPLLGGFLAEVKAGSAVSGIHLGTLTSNPAFETADGEIKLSELESAWTAPLAKVYPLTGKPPKQSVYFDIPAASSVKPYSITPPAQKVQKPKVTVAVFPGTNCEYDVAKKFLLAGAEVETVVIKNLTAKDIEQSIARMAKSLSSAQIFALPGGFSCGDEPDGSGKFITAFLRSGEMNEAVCDLLYKRDGLMLGICNGFQALVKVGLLPSGKIIEPAESNPTLAHNDIGRHQSLPVRLKVVSANSPWMSNTKPGTIYTAPISHGEGKFIADAETIQKLAQNGQIATQYCDENGNATMALPHNPNGSYCAIEGIFSPDGRIFGKMAHDERCGQNLLKNVGGSEINIFKSGVDYFRL